MPCCRTGHTCPVSQPGQIRVVVGEDQSFVREGIVSVLQDGGFDVVGTTGNAEELVQMAAAYGPDVVIADIQMPPDGTDDGLRAALAIRAAHPGTGVLVLSQFLEDRYAFDLVAGGAQGVCEKCTILVSGARSRSMRGASARW